MNPSSVFSPSTQRENTPDPPQARPQFRDLALANPWEARFSPLDRVQIGVSWGFASWAIYFVRSNTWKNPNQAHRSLMLDSVARLLHLTPSTSFIAMKKEIDNMRFMQESIGQVRYTYHESIYRLFRGPTALIVFGASSVLIGLFGDIQRALYITDRSAQPLLVRPLAYIRQHLRRLIGSEIENIDALPENQQSQNLESELAAKFKAFSSMNNGSQHNLPPPLPGIITKDEPSNLPTELQTEEAAENKQTSASFLAKVRNSYALTKVAVFEPFQRIWQEKKEQQVSSGQLLLSFVLLPFRITFESSYLATTRFLHQKLDPWVKQDIPLFFWEVRHRVSDFFWDCVDTLPDSMRNFGSNLAALRERHREKQIYFEDEEDHYLEGVRARREEWHRRMKERFNKGFDLYDDQLEDYVDLHPRPLMEKYPHVSLENPLPIYYDELGENYVRRRLNRPSFGWGDEFGKYEIKPEEEALHAQAHPQKHTNPRTRARSAFTGTPEEIAKSVRDIVMDTSQQYPYPQYETPSEPLKQDWLGSPEEQRAFDYLYSEKGDPTFKPELLENDPSDYYIPWAARRNMMNEQQVLNREDVRYYNQDPDANRIHGSPLTQKELDDGLMMDYGPDPFSEYPESPPTMQPPFDHYPNAHKYLKNRKPRDMVPDWW